MALKDGLLHWWELGDTSWLDSHGSWHLTNRTAVSINSTGAPDGGPAAVFNGSHYLDRTNVAWDGSGAARSLQIWARYSALSQVGNWLISHRGSNAATILHQAFFSNPDGLYFDSINARCSFSDGTTARTVIGDANPPTDTWLHILATTNGNRHRLYVNADMQHESTGALSGVISTAQPFSIGAESWNKSSIIGKHRGLACLAAIWQREVSESEAVQLYNGGAGRRYAALDMVSGSGAKIARLRRAHAGIRGMRA